MEALIKDIKTRISLPRDLQEAIEQSFKKEEIKRDELILRENQICKKIYFVEKGTLRSFYNHNGKEITSWFYVEDMFLSSWYSFYAQEPGFEYLEAIEDCTLYSISYFDYEKLFEEFHHFERFGRKIAEEHTAFIDYYSKGYMFLTAKEKYKLILEYFPDIEFRVKLGHLASFLGISQETLSRIRAGK